MLMSKFPKLKIGDVVSMTIYEYFGTEYKVYIGIISKRNGNKWYVDWFNWPEVPKYHFSDCDHIHSQIKKLN